MSNSLIFRLNSLFRTFEHAMDTILGKFPPPSLNFAVNFESGASKVKSENSKFSLENLMRDGFLLAVPKHRRTVEKRLQRKFGMPEYTLKILQEKTNIRTCHTCGDHHEIGHLCPTCYKKIMNETKLMQEKIQEKLGLSPVEKEIVVLYENEKSSLDQNKEFVEMKKPRPNWFSKNLLQQTTQPIDEETKDVKPSGLS